MPLHDEFLYECLALVDALRDGRVRGRHIAEKELRVRLRKMSKHPNLDVPVPPVNWWRQFPLLMIS
jgi:hypothetical protein